jgi:exodeoxyribonuclease V alpha subunit
MSERKWRLPAMPTDANFDCTPTDPRATELAGELRSFRNRWDNDDGTQLIIAMLVGGDVVRGVVEARGELLIGGHYRFLGRWEEHARYGWQFAFDSLVPDVPEDVGSLIAYLSRTCPGIGPVTARKLVEAHGRDVVRRLIEEPASFGGDGEPCGTEHDHIITSAVAQAAGEALTHLCDPALRDAHLQLFSLLRGHGFYAKAIRAALRKWKAQAAVQVRRDPFLLMTNGMPGCGFLKCDRLYLALGKRPERLKRQGLAAWHAMAHRDGDTWMSLAAALEAIRLAIGGCEPRERRAVALMIRARMLTYRMDPAGGSWIAEWRKASHEREVAARILDLMQGPPAWPAVEGGLSDHQRGELLKAFAGRVAILTGSPGTGKTFAAAAAIGALIRSVGADKIAVCAPTGKAAVRLSEKLQDARLPLQATTIHRLLKVRPNSGSGTGWSFEFGADQPLPHRVVVADEMSMVDIDLAASLLRACGVGTHLLIVGDKNQLPPVGHGAFLRDLIDAGIPTATLSEIRRNAGRIVHVCRDIKDGVSPELPRDLAQWPAENLIHLPLGREGPESKQQMLLDKLRVVYDWLPGASKLRVPEEGKPAPKAWDLIDDVQVICARNATRLALNRHLQQELNPAGQKGLAGFRVSDKVICLKNGLIARADYSGRRGEERQEYCANGDIGRVEGFRSKAMIVKLRSPDRLVAVPLGKARGGEDGDDQGVADVARPDDGNGSGGGEDGKGSGKAWDLAYCCTTHKFQGSECPVVIVLIEGAGKLGSRELIYTAFSRARELCLVIGEKAEITRYVKNLTLPDRKTFLTALLKGEMPP